MKSILILGCAAEQVHAIKLARKIGYRTIAMDRQKTEWCDVSDVFICRDPAKVLEVIGIASRYRVDGILCHAIELSDVCAEACHMLGLPGLNPTAARICSDKLKLAECLKGAGVPHPETERWPWQGDLFRSETQWIVKPSDNSGARGVTLMNKWMIDEELDVAWQLASGYCRSGVPIKQEYIAGKQISIEGYLYVRKFHCTALADRHYDHEENLMLEDGHTTPADLTYELADRITKMFVRAIGAVGIDFGPVKGDIIIDADLKIWILEVAARTSGGRFISGTVPLAFGYEPLETIIRMAVGDGVIPIECTATPIAVASQRYLWADRDGIITFVAKPNAAWSDPAELIFPSVGSRVRIAESHADRLGWVIVSDATRENAQRRAIEIRDSITIAISPETSHS